jgi:hypothetical protein
MNRRRNPVVVACVIVLAFVGSLRVYTHGSVRTTVIFDREIVRMLESRCVSCHNEGGLSFPLSTYEQSWVKRASMRTEVLRRHMPPWSAVAGYGEFANDNGLTLRETQFLISWVEGLGPRNAGATFLNVPGAQSAPPPVRAVAHVGHWWLGEPDVTRRLDTIRIEAGAGDVVRRTIVDLGLTAPRLVNALEFIPGNRRAVRAAMFTVEATGQWLGSWTPWYGFAKLPDGVAHRLPAGARIVAEVHYRVGSEPVADSGTLGLFFARGRPKAEPSDLVLEAGRPSGRGGTSASPDSLRASVRLTADSTVWALKPDVTPGITSMELSARTRDGRTDVLLLALNPPAAWPTPYVLKSPLRLTRGTELRFVVRRAAARPAPIRLVLSRY